MPNEGLFIARLLFVPKLSRIYLPFENFLNKSWKGTCNCPPETQEFKQFSKSIIKKDRYSHLPSEFQGFIVFTTFLFLKVNILRKDKITSKENLIFSKMLTHKLSSNNLSSNLSNLMMKVGRKFLVIYREILSEKRVIIFSRELPISQLNHLVLSLQSLFQPLNLSTRFYPFETLTSIKLLRLEKAFIVGFNNPIVKR